MSGDYWDNRNAGVGPNLQKLPLDIRKSLTQPIPLREGEEYGRIVLFNRTPGLVHPNGRVNVTQHQADPLDPKGSITGIQIDAMDFSARLPLATFILAKKAVPGVLTNLLRAFISLGATPEQIAECVANANKAPRINLSAVMNYEEEASNE